MASVNQMKAEIFREIADVLERDGPHFYATTYKALRARAEALTRAASPASEHVHHWVAGMDAAGEFIACACGGKQRFKSASPRVEGAGEGGDGGPDEGIAKTPSAGNGNAETLVVGDGEGSTDLSPEKSSATPSPVTPAPVGEPPRPRYDDPSSAGPSAAQDQAAGGLSDDPEHIMRRLNRWWTDDVQVPQTNVRIVMRNAEACIKRLLDENSQLRRPAGAEIPEGLAETVTKVCDAMQVAIKHLGRDGGCLSCIDSLASAIVDLRRKAPPRQQTGER
jgi:hypothetical protein